MSGPTRHPGEPPRAARPGTLETVIDDGGPLAGWRVLIPRDGSWADEVAERLRTFGATPVIASLIAFRAPTDDAALRAAVARLGAGDYDWLVLTSSTTVDVLAALGATVPHGTRVAAVGARTGAAARAAGLPVDLVPSDHSAAGLVAEWPGEPGERVLLPQSALADETLPEGLGAEGVHVERVVAYGASAVPAPGGLAAEVAAGAFRAVLVTAGSVAARVADEFPEIPETTAIVCIGPRTAGEAEAAGLRVTAQAAERSADAMVDGLLRIAGRVDA